MAAALLALPDGPRGRLLAIALAGLVCAAAWLGLASPLLDWYGERAERLAQRAMLERRMAAIAATLPALQREAAAAAGSTTAAALVEGATDAVAAARLQEMMQAMAARVGANLASLETLQAEPAGADRRIGLRVTLNASWPVLVALLHAVADATPPLLVDDLRLQGSRLVVQTAAMPLDASFAVLAFRADIAAPK